MTSYFKTYYDKNEDFRNKHREYMKQKVTWVVVRSVFLSNKTVSGYSDITAVGRSITPLPPRKIDCSVKEDTMATELMRLVKK
ncbi:hypothetical protein SAMD00019534_013980 [Acytostelium subglobosum LB1]|uniref:hypothetical protein n=1 Tax=Acytostelium subglobosum LB1 TaxID=1410327 RepID=UPI0006450C6B|nr:hypothetical protein SAMD00019534_013980 [Acytostelium subglobosum LB1]GAM18223.1 hypothetical protein SAMD00019534_013980 [Acytostelium subglobosum LB1]|eukprot:XP_012758819.1 hypothetical protein SAMD00019534_013980 [Acytostelium subglobosum LB1]